jgi:hypothetical protein
MGSVIDYIDCPDCGKEAYMDYYYKTGEEYINCNNCGYSRNFSITNWSDSDVEGWKPEYKLIEQHGCGAYKIRPHGAIGYECGAFTEPASEQEFVRLINERSSELAHAEYTTFIDGIVNRVILIQEEEQQTNNEETYE